ncbi:hypothetical protein INR49_024693 [Caranx melampygus]|nr:hypothetical protein INR49_024693 [Caranx melampygus]
MCCKWRSHLMVPLKDTEEQDDVGLSHELGLAAAVDVGQSSDHSQEEAQQQRPRIVGRTDNPDLKHGQTGPCSSWSLNAQTVKQSSR